MAKLKAEVQRYIVTQLAIWERPIFIQAAVKARFGVEVSLPAIAYYDPTNVTADLAERWTLLFYETRAAYRRQVGNIGISHQVYRLKRLDKMFRRAEGVNDLLALQVLALAAKEAGGFYARHPQIEPPVPALTREQRRSQLREFYRKLMEQGWRPPEPNIALPLREQKGAVECLGCPSSRLCWSKSGDSAAGTGAYHSRPGPSSTHLRHRGVSPRPG